MKPPQCNLELWVIGTGLNIPKVPITYWNTPDMKLDPRSDCTTLGKPTMILKVIRAFDIFLAERFLMGITSGNLIKAQIIVTRYCFSKLMEHSL